MTDDKAMIILGDIIIFLFAFILGGLTVGAFTGHIIGATIKELLRELREKGYYK